MSPHANPQNVPAGPVPAPAATDTASASEQTLEPPELAPGPTASTETSGSGPAAPGEWSAPAAVGAPEERPSLFGQDELPLGLPPAAGPAVEPTAEGAGDVAPEGPPAVGERGAVRRTRFQTRSFLTLLAGTVSVSVALAAAGTGFVVGTRHAALGPVTSQVVDSTQQGLDEGQVVYETARDAVVTIAVPRGGSGSGFFYRPDRIVTNAHVVSSSVAAIQDLTIGHPSEVEVILADGRKRTGKVLAVDVRLDVAIIEVPDDLGVKPLTFVDSSDAKVGQDVWVLGSPFGLSQSLSAGIISGVSRNTQFATDSVQTNLLQVDAPVNPGNSGGPLLDATGAVLGVVTLRPDSAEGRSTAGLAFALPANSVRAAIDQLERDGEVSHPVIGVSVRDANSDDRPAVGAVVVELAQRSGAAKAGLKAGDVIVAVNGKRVSSAREVSEQVVGHRSGDKLTVTVAGGENGQDREVVVTLTERAS